MVGAPDVGNFLYVCGQWAQALSHYLGGQSGNTLLDIGCGCGRPARALLNDPRVTAYLSLDADPTLVHWCNAWLRPASGWRFLAGWLDVYSEAYHQGGTTPAEQAVFPAPAQSASLIFAASLFTHLAPAASARYLPQARRCAIDGAMLLLSIHIAPAPAADFSGNSDRADYTPAHFVALARAAGWALRARPG